MTSNGTTAQNDTPWTKPWEEVLQEWLRIKGTVAFSALSYMFTSCQTYQTRGMCASRGNKTKRTQETEQPGIRQNCL